MRYYDTVTKTETHTESETTIISSDSRVAGFFKPLKDGYRLEFDSDNLPLIVAIPEPTQAELDEQAATQYQRDRDKAYPTQNEQNDMAYWDRQNGTTTLDDAISAVKLQFPKPKG